MEDKTGSKRKTKTSTEVKARYNKKVYTVIAVSVPKEIAKAFKEKCSVDGIPQAQVLKRAINEYLGREQEQE